MIFLTRDLRYREAAYNEHKTSLVARYLFSYKYIHSCDVCEVHEVMLSSSLNDSFKNYMVKVVPLIRRYTTKIYKCGIHKSTRS